MFGVDDIAMAAGVVGMGMQIGGLAGQQRAQKNMAAAQQEKIQAQMRAEQARMQQMELESIRRQRDVVRNAQLARSMGLAKQAGAGGQYGSAFGGMIGQVQSQAGRESTANYENLGIGRQIFQANMDAFGAESRYASAQSKASANQGIMGLGSSLMTNSQQIGRLGNTAYNYFNPQQTNG